MAFPEQLKTRLAFWNSNDVFNWARGGTVLEKGRKIGGRGGEVAGQ